MPPFLSDTSAGAEKVLVEGYRRMSIPQKLRQVRELTQLAQQMAMTDIRRRYPNASPRECDLRLASRWIDAELMRRAFGWDPDKEGY
jgi:hypothetical protein